MWIDFLIGLCAANAIPHFVLGCLDAQVLGLFGYGPKANIAYALFCSICSLALFHYRYGLATLGDHWMLLGVLCVAGGYYIGWPIVLRRLSRRQVSGWYLGSTVTSLRNSEDD